MAHRILPAAAERYEIHNATCRSRRQNLSCSLCSDLHERALRAWNAQATTVTRACGHERHAVLSADPQIAATEIEQLVSGPCGPCVKVRRQTSRALIWSEVA